MDNLDTATLLAEIKKLNDNFKTNKNLPKKQKMKKKQKQN